MRIRIVKYDAKKEAPVDPAKESFRAKELRMLKTAAIILIAVIAFGGIFSYAKIQCVHETEGPLQSVERVRSGGTKYTTLAGLNLQIGGNYYYLDADYIYNDGREYLIDHIQEMQQLLESDKALGQPMHIQYIQLTNYDKPIIIGAVCGDIYLLNSEHSLRIRQKQLYFDLLLGLMTCIIFICLYLFRKKYSICIEKAAEAQQKSKHDL